MATIALLGAPNAGKSALFCALTGVSGGDAPAPFSTEEPVSAPLSCPGLLPAVVIDLPGIARDSHAGQWLGLEWLDRVRDADVLVMVTKTFQTGAGPLEQPGCTGDPLWDLEMVERELQIADVHAIERRLQETAPDDPGREMLEQVGTALAGGQPAREMGLPPDEMNELTGTKLVTRLPVVYVHNIDERALEDPLLQAAPELLTERMVYRGVEALPVCARLEADAAMLGREEGAVFLAELGVDKPVAERLAYAVKQVLSGPASAGS